MTDTTRRLNNIIVKNLPPDLTKEQFEKLFSKFGTISSSRILTPNPSFEGNCGFINYADSGSCNKAVEHMDHFEVEGYTLYVNHSRQKSNGNNFNRSQAGSTNNTNQESMNTTTFVLRSNSNESDHSISPSNNNRLSTSRSTLEQQCISSQLRPTLTNSTCSNIYESDTIVNMNRSSLNHNIEQKQQALVTNTAGSSQNEKTISDPLMTIKEHEPFLVNKSYNIYISSTGVPNVIFAATLDDYVHASLLMMQMNKHEKLAKIEANSLKAKLFVDQICAARYQDSWYRARILEVNENRARVQYIDWGNTGWCDSILEIRPLPMEYCKDPVLCMKCILDGVPFMEKLSEEQINAIHRIIVLNHKLDIFVLRIENNIPYVRLSLSDRNLNNEVLSICLPTSVSKQETHYAQLTATSLSSDCFHVLLMHDSLPTIIDVLKEWDIKKIPLATQPKPNMLVCAQYDLDDLWYRAWIKNVTGAGYHIHFVDFGNEEIVSIDRLSDCPDVLRSIPWLSVEVRLANIQLTNEERDMVFKDFANERCEMKVIQKNRDVYDVNLFVNGKSLADHVLDSRKKNKLQETCTTPGIPKISNDSAPSAFTKVSTNAPVKPKDTVLQMSTANSSPTRSTIQIKPEQVNNNEPHPVIKTPVITPTNTTKAQSVDTQVSNSTSEIKTHAAPVEVPMNPSSNENLTTLIAEQRRQTHLLEKIFAAITTTNALLNQLVIQHEK